MKRILLEVCVDSTESAIMAQKGGADRLELCANLMIGGTTPDESLYKEVRRYTDLPVRVLIRPRFGDFCYTDHEFNIMLDEIQRFKALGADAVVSGILLPDGNVDAVRTGKMVQAAGNMEFTFHRAFDMSVDPEKALDDIRALGIGTVLTSGQKETALEGADLLSHLLHRAGDALTIMPGSGVNAETLKKLVKVAPARVYHMSGKKVVPGRMQYHQKGVRMGLPVADEYEIWRTDEKEIRAAREILDDVSCTTNR